MKPQKTYKWDVFISHASEDKVEVALPLQKELEVRDIKVWIDKQAITVGDSLRRKIDEGLSQSKYGVVILSKNFFNKEWPQKELDALIAREDGKEKVILPIWHDITESEIIDISPLIAGKLAINSDIGIPTVAQQIELVVRESLDVGMIFSAKDIHSLSEAIRFTVSRDGSFSSLDPLTAVSGKVRKNELVRTSDFTDTELAVLLRAVNENLIYVSNYDYGEFLDKHYVSKRRAEIVNPLNQLRDKIQKAIHSSES